MRRQSDVATSFCRIVTMCAALLGACTLDSPPAAAYPEFQRSILKTTARPVNCAFCHAHADGPEGTAPGQIGRLSAAELAQLGQARAALSPDNHATSPILNPFGNHLLNRLGKKRILELRLVPMELASALPFDSDLDHDGITDRDEYRAGTHPLLDTDGDPWKLFQYNFWKNRTSLILTLLATILGLYGLKHLLHGFAFASGSATGDNADRENDR